MSEMRRLLYSDSTGPCQIEATTFEVDPDKSRNLLVDNNGDSNGKEHGE